MCRTGRRAFFGQPLPERIAHVEMIRDPLWQELQVRWITMDGGRHSMSFEQSDEGVTAALVAMKLTV